MKKNKIYCAFLTLFTLCSLAISLLDKSSSEIVKAIDHDKDCFWNHYKSLDATLEDNGVKEYYICCKHHTYSFSIPSEGSISILLTPSTSFTNSLSNDDDRVILSYTKQAEIINNKIDYLKNNWNLDSFSIFKYLNECNYLYENFNDSFKYLIKESEYLTFLNKEFNNNYTMLVDASSKATIFSNREYGSVIESQINNVDKEVSEIFTLNNINGSDTFWVFNNSNFSLNDFSSISFYVKPSNDFTLGYRAKINYSDKLKFSIKKDEWNLITIPTDELDALSDLGLSIWFGSNYQIDYLSFSSFFGKLKTVKEDIVLFDASKDEFTHNDYVSNYSHVHSKDENGNSVYTLENMSSSTDWLFFKTTKSLNLNSYCAIYFKMKTSVDTTIEIRETYTGYATLIKRISLIKDEWTLIVLNIDEKCFPNNNLNNLGISKYLEGGHTESTSGTWSFTSFYGIQKENMDGYEVVDGIRIPSYKKEGDFNITAYAPPKIDENNYNNVFSGLVEAGFNKIIPLYNGRNYTLETNFGSVLKSYNSAILSSNKEKYKTELFDLIEQFMNSIKSNNSLIITKAKEYNIKVVDFISLIYDLEDILTNNDISSLKESIYKEVMDKILSLIDYADSNYEGLFLKDEPNVKNDFSTYKTFIDLYKNYNLNGSPLINLLPLGDDGNSNNYTTYLNNYMNNIFPSTSYISFDQYPMKCNGDTMTNHLYNLSTLSHRIKSTPNAKFNTFIHTTKNDDSTHNISGIKSKDDILFQMNANIAFGSKDISYFVYSSNGVKDNGLVNFDTLEKLDLYNYAQLANKDVLNYASYYSYFDFDGVNTYGSNPQFNKIENKLTSFEKISSVSNSSPTLISQFKQGEQYAYYVMNYINPQSNSAINDTVNLTFSSDINYCLVFLNNDKYLCKIENGGMELKLDAGNASFIIPLSI